MGAWFGNRRTFGGLRAKVCVGVACALLVLSAAPLHADNAPLQPTTAGLMPGVHGTTVRMASEKVDLNVTERDGAVHAIVNASFDMFNRGSPAVNLTVGFPKFNGTYMVAGGFAGFDPTQFADFRAASGSTSFQPTVKPVAFTSDAEKLYAGDWYVWQMDYPGNKTTNVQVSYDQTISPDQNGAVYISYILRTGALWDDTIGDATITMSSGTGGAFLLPSADEVIQGSFDPQPPHTVTQQEAQTRLPTSSATNQVAWHLSDFKPSFDPFVFYVPGDKWQRLTSAQARLAADSPAASDYAAATQAFFDAFGRDPSGLPAVVRHHAPQALKDRYDQVRGWTDLAIQLDPTSPAALDALGDMQYVSEARATLYLSCRPELAPVSYQRAVELGSSTAQAKLDGINMHIRNTGGKLLSCSTDPNQPAAQPLPDTLTDGVRMEIMDAVDRANSAWSDSTYTLTPSRLTGQVAGDELTADLAELETLRRDRQRRKNVNTAFDVINVTLDAPGHAIVQTQETWSAEIYDMATGQLQQQTPPATYTEAYTVEFIDGGWIVTKNKT